MVERQEVEVADPWQRLEADFARVLGEIPKPEGPEKAKGPEPVFVRAADGTYYAFEEAREDACVALVGS